MDFNYLVIRVAKTNLKKETIQKNKNLETVNAISIRFSLL